MQDASDAVPIAVGESHRTEPPEAGRLTVTPGLLAEIAGHGQATGGTLAVIAADRASHGPAAGSVAVVAGAAGESGGGQGIRGLLWLLWAVRSGGRGPAGRLSRPNVFAAASATTSRSSSGATPTRFAAAALIPNTSATFWKWISSRSCGAQPTSPRAWFGGEVAGNGDGATIDAELLGQVIVGGDLDLYREA